MLRFLTGFIGGATLAAALVVLLAPERPRPQSALIAPELRGVPGST